MCPFAALVGFFCAYPLLVFRWYDQSYLSFHFMPYTAVNLLAVLGATLATMILGMLWYSPPVFGKMWMRETGITAAKAEKGMKRSFIIGTLSNLLLAYFLALLLVIVRPGSFQAAFLFGSMLWLGIVVPLELSGVAWERRSWTLLLINAGWSLVSFLVIVSILFLWS